MIKKVTAILMVLVLSMIGVASAEDPGPSINICTIDPAECASPGTTLVVYEGTVTSENPGLYAHFADWITDPATPGSIWVVDTVAHGSNLAGNVDYGPVAVSIDSNSEDALYEWIPDGQGDIRYKVYAHATQDPNDPGLFADVTVRTRVGSVPELPTSVLTMVGIIGLIGMVMLRKK